jgi:hypothetical protein
MDEDVANIEVSSLASNITKKEEVMEENTRFIGIDLSKRSMEVALITKGIGKKLIQKKYATTPKGKL